MYIECPRKHETRRNNSVLYAYFLTRILKRKIIGP